MYKMANMAELEEQAAKAQEDAQKGCMGSLLTLGFSKSCCNFPTKIS